MYIFSLEDFLAILSSYVLCLHSILNDIMTTSRAQVILHSKDAQIAHMDTPYSICITAENSAN